MLNAEGGNADKDEFLRGGVGRRRGKKNKKGEMLVG